MVLHELSLVSAMLKILHAKVKEGNVQKVIQVNLTIGEMTYVEEGTLKSAFAVCTEGTILENTRLFIERIPVQGKCRQCNREFLVINYQLQCPQCNEGRVDIIGGKEFYIKSMEVE